MSAPVAKRSAGFFVSALSKMASTRPGRSGRIAVTGRWGSFAITNMSLVMDVPRNGRWPVSNWYRLTPSANKSACPLTFFPSNYSGDMNEGVPSTIPVRVRLTSIILAIPKSVSFKASVPESYIILEGLMSLWTMLLRWA